MKRVLILGATSAIARSLAARMAEAGWALYLAGRNLDELDRVSRDLQVRFGAEVLTGLAVAEDRETHAALVNDCIERLGGVDGAVFAIGLLGNQPDDSHDGLKAGQIVDVNFTSATSMLGPVADHLEIGGDGFILGLSSVAGDRGRKGNYAYGSAKAGLSTFLQGLRNRCENRGVRVYTVKLGFVDTAMTYGKEGMFLVASPESIARSLMRILNRPSGVYYLPFFWRGIMGIIRLIPEGIYKRLDIG